MGRAGRGLEAKRTHAAAMCRNVIRTAPIAIAEPDNEEARETLSLASYMITGGIVDQGGSSDMPLHLTH